MLYLEQEVYRAGPYQAIYINQSLYEEIFQKPFCFQEAKEIIEEMFSITLESNGEAIGKGYVDYQSDPTGIALAGNKGSGRAFFYKDIFNIKGIRTKLATSQKIEYSDGKYNVDAALHEALMANVLSEELPTTTFKTLAVLLTGENHTFKDYYVERNGEISEVKGMLPCAIEVRVAWQNELLRVSNWLQDKSSYNFDLETFCSRVAEIEAYKFHSRLLHGSWSVGNISVDANLIDFDTSLFVKGRNPQFSNTCKYKANYFGNEVDGQVNIIKILGGDTTYINQMINIYKKKSFEIFLPLIGLESPPQELNEDLKALYTLYNQMSRMYVKGSHSMNVYNSTEYSIHLYDFSKFFSQYLLDKRTLSRGLVLLLNPNLKGFNVYNVMYDRYAIEFFDNEYGVDNPDADIVGYMAYNFIQLYNKIFDKILPDSKIVKRAYFNSLDREYLTGGCIFINWLMSTFQKGKLTASDISLITNHVILTEQRALGDKPYYNIALRLTKHFLYYIKVFEDYYQVIVVPYERTKVHFMKIIIGSKDYVMSHQDTYLESEKIYFKHLFDIQSIEIDFITNGIKRRN